MASRTRPWFYYFANSALRVVFRIILDVEVRGLENVPPAGPLIIAISHSSFVDPLVTAAHIRRDITPMAKAEAFSTPLLKWIVEWYGAFPVRRGEVDLAAFKTALSILHNGQAMIIAPEGHRSESGSLQRGREGAIMLSLRSGAPILPVAIYGGKLFWKNLARFRRTSMWLHIGEPVLPADLGRKPNREQVAAMGDELMVRIAAMMPESIRGYYSDLSVYSTHFLRSFAASSAKPAASSQQKEVVIR